MSTLINALCGRSNIEDSDIHAFQPQLDKEAVVALCQFPCRTLQQ